MKAKVFDQLSDFRWEIWISLRLPELRQEVDFSIVCSWRCFFSGREGGRCGSEVAASATAEAGGGG